MLSISTALSLQDPVSVSPECVWMGELVHLISKRLHLSTQLEEES